MSLLDTTSSPTGLNEAMDTIVLTKDDAPYESDDSELSIPNVDDEASPASNHQSESGAQGAQDSDASESSDAEAQDQSDDADFDMEDNSPAPLTNGGREQSSTSSESRRPAKRKLPVEDEHILANPELYGLRRSVRGFQTFYWQIVMLTFGILGPPCQSTYCMSTQVRVVCRVYILI